jgi:hypothetical protein
MASYHVTAVQFDTAGEVAFVRWMENNNVSSVAEVAEVVEAIDRGDIVEMHFGGHALGSVSGGRLCKKILPNGKVTVAEASVIPGRTLFHLPRI